MVKEKRSYNRIRVGIAQANCKNKDVAEALKVSEQTVSKWVTNTTQPTIAQLYDLADYLQISPADLLEFWAPNK